MMPKKMCAFTNRLRKWLGCGKNRQTGFTLLELILSIAILSAVLVTIYATLSMGSRTWEKGERDIEKVQRMRVTMDLLSREIKSTYPYRVTPGELDTHKEFYAFDGKKDYLSFVSCIPLSGGTGRLSWLTIWVEEGEGLVVVERDALRSDIFEEREAMDKDEMVALDANVIDIRFEYYRADEGDTEEAAEEETAWEEKWDAEEEGELPQAVSVAVTFREEATREGADDDVYTRELVIPLATWQDNHAHLNHDDPQLGFHFSLYFEEDEAIQYWRRNLRDEAEDRSPPDALGVKMVPVGYIYLAIHNPSSEHFPAGYTGDLAAFNFGTTGTRMSLLFDESPSIRKAFLGLLERIPGVCGVFNREDSGEVFWMDGREVYARMDDPFLMPEEIRPLLP